MLLFGFICSILFSVNADRIYYDSYTGREISLEEVKRHDKSNNTFWCVTEIESCDPREERRVDGSCNNLKHPTRGAPHTPFARVLPPVFAPNYEPKTAASGNEMPLARYLRTNLVSIGRVPSQLFTSLAVHYLVFLSADVVSLHDTVNYVMWKPYCCTPKGKTDYMCAPNKIPEDDPVHRFSGVRCLNMTRPETYQSLGCVSNNTSPERIVSSTPLLDLNTIYGSTKKSLNERGRTFEGGRLKVEVESGRIWPPSTTSPASVCYGNRRPQETRCHATPEDGPNSLAGINLVSIWTWRYHNHIAKNLAAVNPCWDDEELFRTARDINIAVAIQIYLYELLPIFLGRYNLIKDGVITPYGGFRDEYNENVVPQVSLEYPFVLRWAHTIQDGPVKLYDTDGYYLKQVPVVNLTLRTGFFAIDDNLDYLTQSSFRQGSAKFDYISDPDITEIGLGPLQYVADLMTSDMAKNRHFGFPPYIKYREFCFGNRIRSFKDLYGSIDAERIEILKEVYETVEDIDLLAGIWVEKPIQGGFVPPTFYCLVVEQLRRNIVSDRHWYERPNRPYAFSAEQLAEIRKVSIARVLCDVGDKVTTIQRNAFLKAGPRNPMINCEEIVKVDFNAWSDNRCSNKEHHSYIDWSKYIVA